MNRTTLLLTRHASTLWNEASRFQGSLDSPLSDTGIAQAKELGKKLKPYNPGVLCTSTLLRTKDTAVIALKEAGFVIPHYEYSGLNEIHLGHWEGKSVQWVQENDPESFLLYTQNPKTFIHPTGEGFEEVLTRVSAAVGDIARRFTGKTVLVITHGFVLCTLLAFLRNIPEEFYRQKIRVPGNTQIIPVVWFL
jgi:probable phosphoglycerate mutase